MLRNGDREFDCDRCGACCRRVKDSVIEVDFDRGDGVCKHYDEDTHLCRIYHNRPLVCNVDAYYDKYLTRLMSRQEFHALNRAACGELKLKAGDM